MIKIIKDGALVLLIIILLFAAINLAAWYYLINQGDSLAAWNSRIEINAMSSQGIALREKIFDTTDRDFLASLEREPALRAHPVLQFTSGLSTEQYTVGLEGIRYLPGWTDETVLQSLNSDNANYVFGGSTTFGHGVPDDDTVVSYMNKLQPKSNWLNFGVNAHDSIRETDKLLHLLRQGYRPTKVVFIDGLNDLTTFMASPYRTADKPRTQGYLIGRGNPALIFGTPSPRNMRLAIAYAFPITHLYFYLTESDSEIKYGELDANKVNVDYRRMSWHFKNKFSYAQANFDRLKSDWTAHYQKNIAFIRQLGDTFGFEPYFVFQPIGNVVSENPFLLPRYKDSPVAIMAYNFSDFVQQKIADGTLDMVNCHKVFDTIDGSLAFVDPTHYSPLGNKTLAQCVLAAINKAEQS